MPQRTNENAKARIKRAVSLRNFVEPTSEFDLKIILPGFETRRRAHAENNERIKSLQQWLASGALVQMDPGELRKAGFPANEARRLLVRLRNRHFRLLVRSFASMKFMRQFRRRYCGAVLKALSPVPDSDIALYTIVPPSWRVPGDALHKISPRRLLAQFRTQLNRAGLATLRGWLIAFVHGEYDPACDAFQLHLHVLVVGEKAAACERLRKLKAYRSGETVRRPILRRRCRNRVKQVSYYTAQATWYWKPSKRLRIPEPRHAEMLLWLNRQRFADLIWLHSCELKRGRLVPNENSLAKYRSF